MDKPRIFLGSSGKQEKLLDALTHGLEDIAHVDPWTTSFNPGTTTLERLVELAHEVDFAAFVFAKDDWTAVGLFFTGSRPGLPARQCRVRGRPFRRRAGNAANLHPPLKGLEAADRSAGPYLHTLRRSRRPPRKSRSYSKSFARRSRMRGAWPDIEGLWWQFSLSERSQKEPSAVSLLRISRDRDGALEVRGRSWQEDGKLSARYWSEAAKRGRSLPACSIIGTAKGLWTRTRRGWRATGRS